MARDYADGLRIAIAAVRAAARVCQAVQGSLVTPETIEKKDKSPVTVADFASQAVVCAVLAEALGDVAVVGEEAADELREDGQAAVRDVVVEQVAAGLGRTVAAEQVLAWIDLGGAAGRGERYWTLDPIDGTKGFLRGEQYAVALALIEGGQVVAGVLGCPNLPLDGDAGATGTLVVASRGRGTRIVALDDEADDGRAVRVRADRTASSARFCESVESGHTSHGESQQVAERLGITAEPVRMDSQAKYATVARGDASIYLRLPTRADYQEKIWDHAAGAICVEEAGGRVTDVTGKPLDFSLGRTLRDNQGVIATSGAIHDEVVAAVRAVLGK